MSRPRLALALSGLLLAGLVAVIATVTAQDPPVAELVRRCKAAQPAWNGYQEDIKEIGARPVAQWHGAPIFAVVKPGAVEIIFQLTPPWDAWEAAVPVLLRDPEGRVMRDTGDHRDGALRVYQFDRSAMVDEPAPPWLEIQFPHTRRKLFLTDGHWSAETP